jgi:hypothetical protein
MSDMRSLRAGIVDHFVFTKKTVYMQRIGDFVRSGHSSYVQGRISIEKAGFLVAKFEERFSISSTKLEASRSRRAGLSSTRLLLLRQDEQGELDWVLLHFQGSIVDVSEKWRDALSDRVNVTGYELVRLTKPEEPHPVWTWRYTKHRYDDLRNEIIDCIRRRDDRNLEQLIATTWRSPGFYGIRGQVKKFKELIQAEWKRTRGSKDGMPDIPDRIGYLRRLSDVGLMLSALRRKIQTQKPASADSTAESTGHSRTHFPEGVEDSLNFFDFLGGDTKFEDLSVDIVALLEEVVARRLRQLEADAAMQASAHEWLVGFLEWPQPRYNCSRPADIVADPRGLAEVIGALAELPLKCF